MNRTMVTALCAAAVTVIALSTAAFASEEEKAPQGKALFTKYKCNSCHAVAAAKIKKTKATSATAKHKPPDLSGVGLERDHEWMEKFIVREEKIEGRLHPIRFKGTKDEREALAAWLETMKTPKEGKAASTTHEGEPTGKPSGTEPPSGTAGAAASESTSTHNHGEMGDTTHAH